jgi:hypothetical protein
MAVVEVHPAPIDGQWIEGFVLDRHVISNRPIGYPRRASAVQDLGLFRKAGAGPSRYTRLRGCVALWGPSLDACGNRTPRRSGRACRWNRRPSISWWTT